MTSNRGGFLPPSKAMESLLFGRKEMERIAESEEDSYSDPIPGFSIMDEGPDLSGLSELQAIQTQKIAKYLDKHILKTIVDSEKVTSNFINSSHTTAEMRAAASIMSMEEDRVRVSGMDIDIDQLLRTIDPKKLIARTFEVCSYEAIMASVIEKLNRQPTSGAIHRSLEFLVSTTHPILSDEDFDYEEYQKDMKKYDAKPRHEKEIDALMNELSALVFVSKARLILNDYPESIAISVQMSPSIEEDETEEAMQAFENVLTSMKPKGLIELEVSITNKVVY